MKLADLKLSHQLVHRKQAVSEEAKHLLYYQKVDTVELALEIFTELHKPNKDYSTIMQKILGISQHLMRDLESLLDGLKMKHVKIKI